MAESFGADPGRYHRARPRYPQALVVRLLATIPGPDVLDVGIGTGISAEGFRASGCRVLGVDPDERMADYARRQGFEVEVATFEDWRPAGRSFDAVISGQAWHWVGPAAGAAKAAQVLRPGGCLAVFWNAMEFPPVIGEVFLGAFRRAVPGAPPLSAAPAGLTGYAAFFADAAEGMRKAGAFTGPEQWQVDWQHSYSRAEWLEVMPTAGGFNRLEPAILSSVLEEVGAAIDANGGTFTMNYATVAVTSSRR